MTAQWISKIGAFFRARESVIWSGIGTAVVISIVSGIVDLSKSDERYDYEYSLSIVVELAREYGVSKGMIDQFLANIENSNPQLSTSERLSAVARELVALREELGIRSGFDPNSVFQELECSAKIAEGSNSIFMNMRFLSETAELPEITKKNLDAFVEAMNDPSISGRRLLITSLYDDAEGYGDPKIVALNKMLARLRLKSVFIYIINHEIGVDLNRLYWSLCPAGVLPEAYSSINFTFRALD